MVRAWVVKGHLVGPSTVQLDEPLTAHTGEVEVILRLVEAPPRRDAGLATFLRSLPPGTRSKADIDRQIQEERESWS
jgi:hypothetical protein